MIRLSNAMAVGCPVTQRPTRCRLSCLQSGTHHPHVQLLNTCRDMAGIPWTETGGRRQMNRQTDTQMDTQTGRQTDRQTGMVSSYFSVKLRLCGGKI